MVVTLEVKNGISSIKKIYGFSGKSTDLKPNSGDMATGSYFYEIDTQNVYMWDEETTNWILQ
jgi:hypothetical protein